MDASSIKSMRRFDSISDDEYIQNSKFRNLNDSAENENQDINKYEDDNKKICCVEMKNNNKVYIEFKEDWTVKYVKKIFK